MNKVMRVSTHWHSPVAECSKGNVAIGTGRKRRTKVATLKSHDSLVRLRNYQHTDDAQEFFWPKYVDEMDEKPVRL